MSRISDFSSKNIHFEIQVSIKHIIYTISFSNNSLYTLKKQKQSFVCTWKVNKKTFKRTNLSLNLLYSQTCQTKMKGDSQSTSERINSNFNFTNITLKINAFKKACLQYKYTFKEVSVSHIWKIGVCKLEKKNEMCLQTSIFWLKI